MPMKILLLALATGLISYFPWAVILILLGVHVFLHKLSSALIGKVGAHMYQSHVPRNAKLLGFYSVALT